jgi:hypothetical protein
MTRFTLIGVPSSAGTHGVGQEKAPMQLRRAGLVERLLGIGLDLVDDGDLPLMLYRSRGPDRQQQTSTGSSPWPRGSPAGWPRPWLRAVCRWSLVGTARSPWG